MKERHEHPSSAAFPLSWHLVALVLSAMIPLVLFSAAMVRRLGQQEREANERRLLIATRELAAALDHEIQTTIRTLEALSESDNLKNGDLERYRGELSRVLSTQPTWVTVLLHRPDGTTILNPSLPEGTPTPIADPESFERLLASRKPTVGNLAVGPREILGFPVRVPVEVHGAFTYVLTGVVSAAALQDIVAPPGSGDDVWTRNIIDVKGTIGARSRMPASYVGLATRDSTMKIITARDSGIAGIINLEGEKVYFAHVRAPFSGWYTTISAPAEIFDAPILRNTSVVTGVGFVPRPFSGRPHDQRDPRHHRAPG